MKLKEVSFVWRCGSASCMHLMGWSSKLIDIPKKWKCPQCGRENIYQFGKVIYKIKEEVR